MFLFFIHRSIASIQSPKQKRAEVCGVKRFSVVTSNSTAQKHSFYLITWTVRGSSWHTY